LSDQTTEPRSRWRRFAPVIVALGAAAALSQLVPHWPHERQIELRLDHPASVTAVEVAWLRNGDAVQGGSWRFAQGAAPPSLTTTIRLPNGAYDVDIEVERSGAEVDENDRRLTMRRAITLGDAERISLVLR